MKNFQVVNNEDRGRVINYLKAINIEKPLSVSIKLYKPNRSDAQNRLYWKWLKIMGDDLGYTDKEMHDLMRDQFLGYTETVVMEKTIKQLVSTADLKVKPFADYLRQIEIFAASDFGDDLYWEAMGIKRK
jgi:hypothetical protein